MVSPKEVIEAIRRDRFGIGIETDLKAQGVIKWTQAALYRSLQKLADDLYSKQNHFVLELIQNADDNEYTPGVTPLLIFKIDQEKIVVQNNEVGFTGDNVLALCDVGNSTKKKAHGYIGEKGIGFKSVFRISDKPQIISNGFRFEFKKNDAQQNFGFIVPHWIEAVPEIADAKLTNIVLPLRQEVKEELTKFNDIDPTLILFLNKLKTIEFHDTGRLVNRVVRHETNGTVKIQHKKGESFWKTARLECPVPPHIREEKRENVESTDLLLAFPLHRNGVAETGMKQPVFAYLPTRSYGFKFIIQADFLVPASREDIHKDKQWNTWIRNNIAEAFAGAVAVFKDNAKLKTTYYNYIPLASEIADPFFFPVVVQINEKLRDVECILTESNNWRKPAEVARADSDVRELILNTDLQRFFCKEYVSSKIVADPAILNALGVVTFGLNEVIACLRNTDWLQQQSDEWLVSLYAYFGKCQLSKAQLQELKKLKILRLMRNRLTALEEDPVFLPLDRKSNYGFEGDLRILKRTLCEPKNKDFKGAVAAFLKHLGVVDAKPYNIIEQQILPVYEKPDENKNWKSKSRETRIGYIRYIKDHLLDYQKERKLQKGNEEDSLNHIKSALWIRLAAPRETYYWKAGNLYLGKAYGNENNLEELFDGIVDESICFVHEEYVQDALTRLTHVIADLSEEEKGKKQEAEIRAWKGFFVMLGAETQIRAHTTGSGSSLDHTSEDLKKIIETKQWARVAKAIKLLDKQWHWYSKYLNAGYSYAPRKSQLHRLLKESDWIPTKQKTLAKPSDVFVDKPEIRKILGGSGTYLGVTINNKDFVRALGINTELTVEAVLSHLNAIVAAQCIDKAIFEQIYRFLSRQFDSHGETIQREFTRNRLIYVPDTSQHYFSAEEVLWKDASDVCGDAFGYLTRYYPKLRSFFVESLEVSERPVPKDYAAFLERLTEKETITEADEKSILRVYEELSRGLNPNENDCLISDELWWSSFIKKSIFWTHWREFRSNNGAVIVANDQELFDLFKDIYSIAFLKLSSNCQMFNYHLKIRHFLDAAKIKCITDIVHCRLLLKETPLAEEEITGQIRCMAQYILRYLFQLHTATYEDLKADGTLDQLMRLTCYSVEDLRVTYSILDESTSANVTAFLDKGNLYIETSKSGDTDYMAIELAKHFGNPPGLEDFLILLFEKKTEDRIQKLLIAKKIGELPPGEMERFSIDTGNQYEVVEEEPATDGDEGVSEEELPDYIGSYVAVDEAEGLEEVIFMDERADEELEATEESDVCLKEDSTGSDAGSGIHSRRESSGEHRSTSRQSGSGNIKARSKRTKTSTSPARTSQRPQENFQRGADGTQADSSQKADWQAECEPEEAAVQVEQFTATRKESRRAQASGTNRGQRASQSDAEYEEDDDGPDRLTQAAKDAIGRWGEQYAMECLRERLVKKYTTAKLQMTYDGFNLWQNNRIIVAVQWFNRVAEVGIGHDIKILEQGKEIFIEVKSSKTANKEWFEVSRKQWEFAEHYLDSFYIYRVLNAGTKQAKLIEIANPFGRWQEGEIVAYPIRVHI